MSNGLESGAMSVTERPRPGIPALLLAAALAANAAFLAHEGARTLKIARAALGRTNEQRRLLIYGGLYADIIRARREVPESATLWWVSPEYPWLVSYYLYPRVMRWGSPDRSARGEFGRRHAGDWIVGYAPNGRLQWERGL
jgi:hypothetical protein